MCRNILEDLDISLVKTNGVFLVPTYLRSDLKLLGN